MKVTTTTRYNGHQVGFYFYPTDTQDMRAIESAIAVAFHTARENDAGVLISTGTNPSGVKRPVKLVINGASPSTIAIIKSIVREYSGMEATS